jgi:flagellar protein FlgJ
MELDLFQVKDIDRTQGKIKSLKGETLTLDDIKEKNTNIRKSTDAFESLMVSMMLKEMRKAIPKSGFLSGGQGEEMFQDMLDNEYARRIS